MFRAAQNESQTDEQCPRCGAPMLHRVFTDGSEEVVCSVERQHDGHICQRIGHSGEYGQTHCTVCAAPAQYVRVEVGEGRAYTYKAYEDPPLEPKEWVRCPGNQVQKDVFVGRVLRVLDGPSPDYAGPYKAVLGRVL